MKTIGQMRSDIETIMKEVGSYRSKWETENRQGTDDEIAHIDGLFDDVDQIRTQIALEERTQKTMDDLEKPANKVQKPNPEKRTRIEMGDQSKRFLSFGEQMAAVMMAGIPGGSVDARLNTRATGLSEGTPADGGFLVQQDFSGEILREAFDTGLLAARCKRVTISSNANSMKINGIDESSRVAGSRWGGIRGYWADEAAEKTASQPKFRKIELNLNKLIGLCYATDELLQDAVALESIIRTGFADEIGFQIDDAIVNGSGAGQPLGILNGGSLVSVAEETGQAATTLVYQNVINMWSRLLARSRAKSVWLINQDVEPQLFQMSLAVGTGGAPVYLPAGGASASPYSTLFGRPVIPIEQCQTLGTKGDIYLADFSGGYILAEKGGVQTDMSLHVRFIYDESVFRFVFRCDGQPVLASAITPYKGSNTLSHFVTLDSRT